MKVLSDFQGVVEGILKSRIYIKMGYDVAVSCGNFCTFTFALCIFAHLLSLCSERNTKRRVWACVDLPNMPVIMRLRIYTKLVQSSYSVIKCDNFSVKNIKIRRPCFGLMFVFVLSLMPFSVQRSIDFTPS